MHAPFDKQAELMAVQAATAVDHAVRVPGSKSLTNRYLLLAALADGESRLDHPLESEDTRHMRTALAAVGVATAIGDDVWTVSGTSAWRAPTAPVFVGNAGTAMRFLTPAMARLDRPVTMTGNARMRMRPIGDLAQGLEALGARIGYDGEPGYPPITVLGPIRAGSVRIPGNSSSQYLSGLLMITPLIEGDSRIAIEGPLVSRTYVAMTLDCMARFGVRAEADENLRGFVIPGGQRYRARSIAIEPDASTASYWFALPLMVGGRVRVRGVPARSHQGDFGLLDMLAAMGARVTRTGDEVTVATGPLHGIEVDMNTTSDVAPTLAAIATRAATPTLIRNVGNMRIKECDRIATLQRAFDLLGLRMESGPDWMKVFPGRATRAAVLDPEDDHRMAMVFALLGLADGGVRIRDPHCVAKTYPGFFEDFGAALTAK